METTAAASGTAAAEMMALTATWERIVRTNAGVCLCLGLPINILVVWLIILRSPEELRTYRKVLLHTALVDLSYLLLSFLVEPVSWRWEH